MHNQESVLENKTYKILCDFKIQSDHLIPARKEDHVRVNNNKKKENLPNNRLCCHSGPQSENR